MASILFATLVSWLALPATIVVTTFGFAAFSSSKLPEWLVVALVLSAYLAGAVFLALCSAGLASLAEMGMNTLGRSDPTRARGWKVLVPVLVAASPVLIVPATFQRWIDGAPRPVPHAGAGLERGAEDARPLGPRAASFWAPATIRIRGGLPEVTVAIRTGEPGDYVLVVQASDKAGLDCSGHAEKTLGSGVDSMTAILARPTRKVGSNSIPWPVHVRSLVIMTQGRADGDRVVDVRSGESLFVIDRQGPTPTRRAAPTAIPPRP
ncbi:MAG: hypothetical protein ABI960_08495 [Candidatus Eisenbacteria bacterium]